MPSKVLVFLIFNSEVVGCPMEQDPTWNITWPATDVGVTATQKCPGGSEAEG